MEHQEQSRLSVLHLVVGTACVAFFASVIPADEYRGPLAYLALLVCYPIFSGIAISGILLFVARRAQRIPYPVHPGEYVFLLLGVADMFDLTSHFTSSLSSTVATIPVAIPFPVIRIDLVGLLSLYFAIRVSRLAWKLVFFVFAAQWGIDWALALPTAWHIYAYLASDIAILTAVALDFWQHCRFPWTHWLGISLKLSAAPLKIWAFAS